MRGNVRVGVSVSARLNVIVCRLFQLLEQNRPASPVIGAWVVVAAVVPVPVCGCVCVCVCEGRVGGEKGKGTWLKHESEDRTGVKARVMLLDACLNTNH